VSAHSKRVDVSLVGEILTQKEKADVFLFIPDRKTIPECPPVASPSAPETEFLIEVYAIAIKRLMSQAFNHGLHDSIVLLGWSLAYYSNDARHMKFMVDDLELREKNNARFFWKTDA
jgi:hypothetical protein